MSQQSVLSLLKKTRKWMTTLEMSKVLKITPNNVNRALSKLQEVKYRIRFYGENHRHTAREFHVK